MIPNKKMSKNQAKQFVEEIDKLPELAFEDLKAQWSKRIVSELDEEYTSLRATIVSLYDKACKLGQYEADLSVGLGLYREFNPDSGFSIVMANDDDIWRYLSCRVFPDITYDRYPKPEKDIQEQGGHLNHKRFYSHTRRIWVKTLWWYIFLSWQGDEATTRETLKDFGTDTISDFIERTGQGYRVELYRKIMQQYSQVDHKSSELFNRIQKQNLVNCKTTEPSLVKDAEAGYVRTLLNQILAAPVDYEIESDSGQETREGEEGRRFFNWFSSK